MANSLMVAPYTEVRRITLQRWEVVRWDPKTGEMSLHTIICEAGTFLAHYRQLGDGFDPYTDTWDRGGLTPKAEWTEVIEVRIR